MRMSRVNVFISAKETGACPFCMKYKKCGIVDRIKKVAESTTRPIHGNNMEIVIYACPEFEENA